MSQSKTGSFMRLAVGLGAALAADYTWQGAASANWNATDANWSGAGSVWADGANNNAAFGDASANPARCW